MIKKIFLLGLVVVSLISCKTTVYEKVSKDKTIYKTVVIDTLFEDNISIRAVLIDDNKIWYAGNNSRFGFYDLNAKVKFEKNIVKDSLKLEFRSNAQTASAVFLLNVANPALLYKISKKDFSTTLVYQENHEKVFYDSMQFWNNKEGIAMGDPIAGSLSIIITRDGGNTWNKIPANELPEIAEGEAAFAASNTNIVIKGNNTWIVSGGKKCGK